MNKKKTPCVSFFMKKRFMTAMLNSQKALPIYIVY